MSDVGPTGISFRLTDEQRELQRLAHEFAAKELRPIAAEWDDREAYPPELLAKAARVGLTSYAIPAEYGGGGADAVTGALIAEELSWGCAGLASTIQATMFPVRPLLRFGTDAQRRRYLPLLAREQGTLAAIAFTEAHAGSDLAAIRATARRTSSPARRSTSQTAASRRSRSSSRSSAAR
jgi:acyl-CoA dehydrogenase